LDSLIFQPEVLEGKIISFFSSMRVKESELPSRSSVESYKSHLKCYIHQESKAQVDLSITAAFPNYNKFMKGLLKDLKQNGKGDVQHKDPIDGDTLAKIYQLFQLVQEAYKSRGEADYLEKLGKIPKEYQDCYHRLMQMGAQFVLQMAEAKRAREGLHDMKKDALTLFEDRKTHFKYFQKTVGEKSKNHQLDQEDIRMSGIIPFAHNEHGLTGTGGVVL
jgi:hypothetical protein